MRSRELLVGLYAEADSDDYSNTMIVLSLDGFQGAQRLARVLLADPLASETPWERRLLKEDGTDERALLLRCANQASVFACLTCI